MTFLKISCTIAFFSIIPILLYRSVRVKYVVHNEGGILITGASSGIGRHAALHLDKMGYTVFACVRKDRDLESLRKAGSSRMQPLILDVTNQDTIDKAVSHIREWRENTHKPLVGIVNNAGIGGDLPVELIPISEVRKVFNVNIFGVYRVTSAFIPFLREDTGRIVNVGSIAGYLPFQGTSAYSATKQALKAITDTTRLEVAQWGISVSIIEPGAVKTNIQGKIVNGSLRERLKLTEEDLEIYPNVFHRFDDKFNLAMKYSESCEATTTPAIVHALTAQYPNTRYLVANVMGVPAWLLQRLIWLAPDRVQDYVKLNSFRWFISDSSPESSKVDQINPTLQDQFSG